MTSITRRKLLMTVASAGAIAALPARAADYPGMAGEHGLFTTINRLDGTKDSAEEKKHVPVITLPAHYKEGDMIPVKVSIGEVPHPMQDDHWIEHIRLFTDTGKSIADIEFDGRSGVLAEFTVTIKAEDTVTLIAQAFCNIHGIWESRVTMEAA